LIDYDELFRCVQCYNTQFVFGIVTIAYVIAVTITVTSVREVPLSGTESPSSERAARVSKYRRFSNEDSDVDAFRGEVAKVSE